VSAVRAIPPGYLRAPSFWVRHGVYASVGFFGDYPRRNRFCAWGECGVDIFLGDDSVSSFRVVMAWDFPDTFFRSCGTGCSSEPV